MASIGEALLIAVDLLEAGKLAEAETLCRRILDADRGQADAWHLSGVAAARAGRAGDALDRFAAAIRIAPGRADLRLNHIAALAALGRPRAGALRRVLALEPARGEAWHALAECARREEGAAASVGPWRALAGLRPGAAELRYNLGVALQDAGRAAEAAAAYAAAGRLDPGLAEAHHNRGNALRGLGRPAEAVRAFRAALAAAPADAGAARNLGLLLLRTDAAAAAGALRIAAAMEPDRAEPAADLAAALVAAGRPAEACAALDAALRRRPDSVAAHNARAQALHALGRDDAADAALARALALDPAAPEAWINRSHDRRERPAAGAAAAARRALRLRPESTGALAALALARHEAGDPEDAAAILRRALAVEPQADPALHSAYLLVRQSDPAAGAAALLADHTRWARLHAPPPGRHPVPARAASDGPVLRIGYLSADLCAHSVASFLEPLLAAHDPARVHTVCYSAVRRPDAVTARLRALAGAWRDVAGLGDAALAALIRADGIDALIELGGHTRDNRLGVLALRPAPVRLTALGYPGTTGLALEGRLTDPIVEPPGSDAFSSEPPVRLPGGFLCYRPPDAAPEPHPRPEGGPPVFGSFNALGKLCGAVVACWAAILRDAPGARLVLKSRALGDAEVADALRRRFARQGVAAERLDLVAWVPDRAAHLALYDGIDVALDPFPYNGTTTTCEALWMGVPVVTLAGDRHAARMGAAILTRAGLPDLIAANPVSYRRTALDLAADRQRLAALRTGLRDRLRNGPLGDAATLAAAVEAACRGLLEGR